MKILGWFKRTPKHNVNCMCNADGPCLCRSGELSDEGTALFIKLKRGDDEAIDCVSDLIEMPSPSVVRRRVVGAKHGS